MKKILVSMLILIFASMSISYALADTTEEEEEIFFKVSSEELEAGDTLEMTIDFTQIEWTQVEFVLTSSQDISSIYSDETSIEITSGEEEETEEYMVSFEADLSILELDEIILYYEIPDDLEVGSTLTLTAVVTDLEDETNTEECEVNITIVENESDETGDESDEIESESTEGKEETTSSDMQSDANMMTQTSSVDYSSAAQSMNQSMGQSSTQSSNQSMDMTYSSNQVTSTDASSIEQTSSITMSDEEEVTYNGSSNNYLSELSIDGYSLNKDFNKESSTYFVTVSDVSSITVTAVAEDDEATVCIYGADDLSDGENKILISVTAENGNVRYYRIYVTKD